MTQLERAIKLLNYAEDYLRYPVNKPIKDFLDSYQPPKTLEELVNPLYVEKQGSVYLLTEDTRVEIKKSHIFVNDNIIHKDELQAILLEMEKSDE